MKKFLTGAILLGGIAAAVAYKLKKDEEQKKMLELELDQLEDEIAEGVEESEREHEDAEENNEPKAEETQLEESKTEEDQPKPTEPTEEQKEENEFPFLDSDTRSEIDSISENVYQQLKVEGDQCDEERPIQHFVDFTSEEDLNAFRNAVVEKGYVVTSGENPLDITVLHIAPIDQTKLVSHIYYIANQALRYNGNYKGWKSRVTY